MKKKPLIGFIGQGFIGKNYADDFMRRGYRVVRYALEEPYRKNKEKIRDCDIVFIAVPTPTTVRGFNARIVEKSIGLVGKGKIAVIKSTILPGTTVKLQKKNTGCTVLYSPEFLAEVTAAHDAAHPFSNIIGISASTPKHTAAARAVLKVLPRAPFILICSSTEAEIIKYTHNTSGYVQIVLFNMLYDLSKKMGGDWQRIHEAIKADPLICNRYAQPVHKSGRGAGGHCFIKDFAALRSLYGKISKDPEGVRALTAFEEKNKKLLRQSKKDLDLLEGVYGKQKR
ncbi:MAG TPA: NAD(P)-binding domain-containing protein [Candidatus Paceibacterota bacterium]